MKARRRTPGNDRCRPAVPWLPVLAWMALIFWLSSLPDLRVLDLVNAAAARLAAAGWTAPAAWLERLGLAAPTLARQPGTLAHGVEVFLRKGAHVVAYAVLAVLARRAAGRTPPLSARPALWAGALAVVYGATDELHQAAVLGRDARLSDVGVDAAGALLGLALAAVRPARRRPGGGRRSASRGRERDRPPPDPAMRFKPLHRTFWKIATAVTVGRHAPFPGRRAPAAGARHPGFVLKQNRC